LALAVALTFAFAVDDAESAAATFASTAGAVATGAVARVAAETGETPVAAQPVAMVARPPATATPPINIPHLRITRMAHHASGREYRASRDLETI
jgi:hypothetical protein